MSAADLPKDWSRRRLRFDARLNPIKSELTLADDAEVSFVPMDAVGELGGLRLDEQRVVDDVYTGYTYFRDDDVLIAKITPCFENGKGAIAAGLTNGVGFGTTELHVVRPNDRLDRRFFFYATIAHDFRSFGESEMLGAGGQKRVPERFLKDWQLSLPPLETQKRIATFLDEKTAQIDALIEKKRALLERLTEKRQAVITQAVTKGLNPAAPMKDSGIDWLGEIPAHWEVKRLKFLGRTRYGLGEPPERDDEGVPFIRATDIYRGKVDMSAVQRVAKDAVPWQRRPQLEVGEVLVVRSGAYTGDSAIVTKGLAGFIAGYDMVYTPEKISSQFIAFTLLSKFMVEGQILIAKQRAAQPHLNAEELGGFVCALPPSNEQDEIVEYLATQQEKLERVEKLVSLSTDRLTEYRSALITAAVTGQIEGLR